jgi:hypothetical protein
MLCRDPRHLIRSTTVSAPVKIPTTYTSQLTRIVLELSKDANAWFRYRLNNQRENIQNGLFFHHKDLVWDLSEIGSRVINIMEIEDGMHLGGLEGGYGMNKVIWVFRPC